MNILFLRVTAYCIAEGFYLGILMEFLRKEHNVQPKYLKYNIFICFYKIIL